MRRLLSALVVLAALAALPAGAAPPRIEAGGALGETLTLRRWQALRVVVSNPPTGDAIQGEVRVVLEDPRRAGGRLATYTRSLLLPAGAGRAETLVYVRLPDAATDLLVQVVDRGQIVAKKKLERLPILPEQLTLLAVSETPDALAFLRGRGLGVVRKDGALQAATAADPFIPLQRRNNRRAAGDAAPGQPLQVVSVTPAVLPDRFVGYDATSVIYLAEIAPDTLSDAQVAALRDWVVSGGLLVVGGTRFSDDERFRSWLPSRRAIPFWGDSHAALQLRRFVTKPRGRGKTVLLGFDAASTEFAARPDAERLWREIAARGISPGSMTHALQSEANPWLEGEFFRSVLRAPNLRAPSFSTIGLFLLLYILLLVPVNYALLRRIDRREWTWATVPVLVLLFSAGAYGFGYAIKGGTMRLNTASLIEMGTDGEGAATASIGLFSPRRATYTVSLPGQNTLLFAPEMQGQMQEGYAPLVVSQESGAAARNADVSMWAMRVFGARTTIRLGAGIRTRLVRQSDGDITGTIENRTDRVLSSVAVRTGIRTVSVGTLQPGQTRGVQISRPAGNRVRIDSWSVFPSESGGADANATRQRIGRSMAGALNNVRNGNQRHSVLFPNTVQIIAWNYDPLLPVRVNGRAVTAGDHANLLVAYAPVITAPR